jgi:hypothetical protein
MRVSISHFPPRPKLSNLRILNLPTYIYYYKCLLVLQTRAGCSRSDYNLPVCPFLIIHLSLAHPTSKHSNNSSCAKMRWCFPHARLWLAMLLHHTPLLENFHGLLSMSSRMVCPCFWISASFSQLASSTGCPFHLTKYSKYSFHGLLADSFVQYGFHLWFLCNWHLFSPLNLWLFITCSCFLIFVWVQI